MTYVARLPDGRVVRATTADELLALIEEHGEALISKSDGRIGRKYQKAKGQRCPNDRRPVLARGLCKQCYRKQWHKARAMLRGTGTDAGRTPTAA